MLGERLVDDRCGIDFESLPISEWTLDECWVWLAAEGAISCETALDDAETARSLVYLVKREASPN